jgi:predicted dehydrogenase
VLVLEQFRYDDNLKALKSALAGGRIGDIVSYEMADHGRLDQGRYNAGGYGNTDWRINPQFPLGVLFDRGIHAITRLTCLFGRPRSVYSLGTRLRADFGEYDHVLMTLAHPTGIHGTFSFAGCLDDGGNYFYIRGTGGTIRVGRTGMEITGECVETVDFPESDSALTMWEQCAECLAGTEPPVYGPAESLDDIALLVAVDESIREGRNILLP